MNQLAPPSPIDPPHAATCGQYAAVLRCDARVMRKRLADMPPDTTIDVSDNPTRAWSFASLPAPLQLELTHAATDAGWRSVDAWLASLTGGASTIAALDNSDLAQDLEAIPDRDKLTQADRAFIWHCAFLDYEKHVAEQPAQAEAVKRSLFAFIQLEFPRLSESPKALRNSFNLKHAKWRKDGRTPQAIADARREKSGRFRRPDLREDEKKIRNRAIEHGGDESMAQRELYREGALSDAFVNYYTFNPRTGKSRVPQTIRARITNEVNRTLPRLQGPHEERKRGPYIVRDWSDTDPGAYVNADDVTWNNFFYFYDDDGQLQIKRGEYLLFIDARSRYPLARSVDRRTLQLGAYPPGRSPLARPARSSDRGLLL